MSDQMLVRGNVILMYVNGTMRKRVVRNERLLSAGEQFVCEDPHGERTPDGEHRPDFSYTCGSDYCRCMQ